MTYSNVYQSPPGYQVPPSPYSNNSYGDSYAPALIGKTRGALPSGFNGNFGALLASLVGLSNVATYRRADLGLTKTGAVVNRWANLLGTSSDAVEGGAGVGIGNVAVGPNGKPSIKPNGTTQYGTYTLTGAVAPATLNYHAYLVENSIDSGVSQVLLGNSGNNGLIWQRASAGDLALYNNSNLIENGRVAGVWARSRASFTGSTAANTDIAKWGNVAQTAGNAGNAAITPARGILGFQDGTDPSKSSLYLVLEWFGPVATASAAIPVLDKAVNSWLKGTVLI